MSDRIWLPIRADGSRWELLTEGRRRVFLGCVMVNLRADGTTSVGWLSSEPVAGKKGETRIKWNEERRPTLREAALLLVDKTKHLHRSKAKR
jgi:hypothetical protein